MQGKKLYNKLYLTDDNMAGGVEASTLEQLIEYQLPVGGMRLSPDAVESWSSIIQGFYDKGVSEDLWDFDLSKRMRAGTVTADGFSESEVRIEAIDARDVLSESDADSVVAGSIDARGVLEMSDGASLRAGSIDARDVLEWSDKGNVVAGLIDTEWDVLKASEGGSVVAGSIDAVDVLKDSDGSDVVAGLIDTEWDVLKASEGGSVVAGSIDAVDVLKDSDGSDVVAGSIDADEGVLLHSDDSGVHATSIQSSDLLLKCSQSYVVAENVASDSIGEGSERSLLVAETVKGDVQEGIEVISGEEREGLTYRGDWDSLRECIGSHLDSRDSLLEALELFTLRGEVDTVGAVRDEFDEIESLYEEDEIREGYSVFGRFEDLLGLEMGGSNHQRAEQLRNIDDIVQEEVQSQYDVTDSNVTRLLDASHLGYVLEKEDKIESRFDGLDVFIETFHGGSDNYADIGFEVEYHFDPDDPDGLTQDTRARNQELYEKGVELIEQIRDGNTGGFDIRDDEYSRKQDELACLGERIDEAFNEGNKEKGQALIKERKRLENEVERLANAYQEEVLKDMGVDQPRRLSLDELREGLNQLYQEHLEESSVCRRARNVANNIETEAAEIGDDTVRITTWDKDMRNLPSYDSYNACVFPGPYDKINRELIDLMADRDTQFLHIQVGGHEGMAITTIVQDEAGRDQLLVDSVQSSSNMFKRRGVTEAVDLAIGDYARRQGVDEVLYNSSPDNTAPQQFLGNLDYEEKGRFLQKDDPAVETIIGRELWVGTRLSRGFYRKPI